jgi:hypothetical protein
VQPVQLSLADGQTPAPPPAVVEHLPEADLAVAVTLLAGVIAKASCRSAVVGGPGGGDE